MTRPVFFLLVLLTACSGVREPEPSCAPGEECGAPCPGSGCPALDAGVPCALDEECPSRVCSGGRCACTSDRWADWAGAFFDRECAHCHGWATRHALVEERWRAIRPRLEADAMPPNGGLAPADRDRAILWIDCEMPP